MECCTECIVSLGLPDPDEDLEQSERELAAEGNATAMSDAERAEYERDGEAWLDAQDEARDLEREAEADA